MFNAELAEVDNRLATSVASNQKGFTVGEQKLNKLMKTIPVDP
jgi:hypothetical protein